MQLILFITNRVIEVNKNVNNNLNGIIKLSEYITNFDSNWTRKTYSANGSVVKQSMKDKYWEVIN